MSEKPKACHNCRRSRLKCDHSLPHCLKCTSRNQVCLGYGVLLRWGNGVASRGKLTGVTSNKLSFALVDGRVSTVRAPRTSVLSTAAPLFTNDQATFGHSLSYPLVHPLAQDLDRQSRRYLEYCANTFVRLNSLSTDLT